MKSSSSSLCALAAAAMSALAVACCNVSASGEAGLVAVSPVNGEAVCLLNEGNRAFVEMDAASRRRVFRDTAWRHEAATRWRSRPSPVRLEWRGGKSGKRRVCVRKNGDATSCFDKEVEGSHAEIWNLEVACEYEWSVADGETTARGTFRTMDIPPRVMSVKGVPNFRDLGGWRTLDGRRVRQGLVYRSQGLNDNARYFLSSDETMALYRSGRLEELYGKLGAEIKARIDKEGGKIDFDPNAPWMRKSLPRKDPKPPLPRLDDETRAYLVDVLGIKSDIDLRRDTEVWGMTGSPLGPCANWLWIPGQAYGGIGNAAGREAFAKVFRVFLDRGRYPIVFHCIGGADRTGCVAWVLNGLLGVAEDDLMKDWEITCFEYESQSFGHEGRIDRFLKLLDDESGATMREKCESFVKSLGFAQSDIDNFRSIMLE